MLEIGPHGLNARAARAILMRCGVRVGDDVRVGPIASGNVVWRLDRGSDTYFLKVPAKDLEWSSDPLDGAAIKVNREASAHLLLRNRDLPAVEVVGVDQTHDNEIGRPFLLTRRAAGDAFSAVVPRLGDSSCHGPLEAVGEYLASTRSIVLARCGFLDSPAGAIAEPGVAPPRGSHDPAIEQCDALRDLGAARPYIPESLYETVAAFLNGIHVKTASEYSPPRFVLGAVHPNHPFVTQTKGWAVSACIDLEVASAGNPLVDDLATFAAGMLFHFRDEFAWWDPLFAGYGGAPSLDRFRLIILSSCFYWFGRSVDLENLGAIYRAVLSADSWSDLFRAHRVVT